VPLTWGQRLKLAWKRLRDGKPFAAMVAVFDKHRTKETAWMEYGHSFPFSEIMELIKVNAAFADQGLITLAARAHDSRSERQINDDELTPEEFELRNHIWKVRRQLARTFDPI
jgi:hypothetical protein